MGSRARGDRRGYDKEAFARRVRELRKARGLTQQQLADATGIKLDTIREYERGTRQPYGENRGLLARALVDKKEAPTEKEALAVLVQGVAAADADPDAPDDDDPREKLVRDERRRDGDDFLSRLESVCRLRKPAATIRRHPSPDPFGAHLLVETMDGAIVETRLLAGLQHGLDEALFDRFVADVDTPYREAHPYGVSELVYGGPPVPPALVTRAGARRIAVKSFSEYQGLIDFRRYVEAQTRRLQADRIYPPSFYVPQRALLTVGRDDHPSGDALTVALEQLGSPYPRFLLVLADFGTGKTFLLHELARRLGEQDVGVVPVLVEMRALEKARSLDALVAQHLALAGMERIDLAAFRYMLEQGRIALLFDGFDELALRVSYDRAAEHFDTLIEAARGNAKIVITSRSQHFLSDQQVKTALAERADRIQGRRMLRLQPFDEEQIRRFLVNALGDEEAAARRFDLLRDVEDLLGLSANPRMLSFIAEVDEEKLVEAKKKEGTITSAVLYRLLLDRWLVAEQDRAHPRGAPLGLDLAQRWHAVTELATRLWGQTEKTVDIAGLPAELCATIQALGAHAIEHAEIRHAIGSGTLLVRDEEGRFSFVHQSVLEWLVANAAAEEAKRGEAPKALAKREMSDLMADFFGALAGWQAAGEWALRMLRHNAGEIEAKNALRMSRRRGLVGVNLAGRDLRGVDLSGCNLQRAGLWSANLEGVRLVGANLEGALLPEARLAGADLSRAVLAGADLTKADLTAARLLGADLRGAKLGGARLRYAALVGAELDPGALEGADTFGMALPTTSRVSASTARAASAANCVAISPDVVVVASGHDDGTVRLWDAPSGKLLRALEGHASSVLSVAFSPDGRTVASASEDNTVRLWETASGNSLRALEGHASSVWSVAFSPDGRTVASASEDNTVRLWETASGNSLRALEGHASRVLSVAFSPDGRTVASASEDNTVRLWETASGNSLRALEGHASRVWSVAFSPDGRTVASASEDNTVRLWETASGNSLRALEGHASRVWSVAFSPDGRTVASASEDNTVRLWETASGNSLRALEGHASSVWSVAFSPDGRTVASASSDKTVRLWETASGNSLRALEGHASSVWSVAFSPDGRTVASASSDKTVRLWETASGNSLRALEGHTDSVLSVAFSPDGRTVASASEDNTVRLWETASGTSLRALEGHTDSVLSVAFSPDGRTVASASEDDTVRLWETASGNSLRALEGHASSVLSVAFSPDGRTVASASSDNTVRLWETASGTSLRALEGHTDSVLSVAFSPDGRTVASASEDNTVRLWETASGTSLRALEGHTDSVLSVAFSPDGRTVASASEDDTVRLWETASGNSLRALEGHASRVWSVAFSPDGRTLASASYDGTIRLWSVATGAHLATLIPRPEGWAAILPDGRYKMAGDIAGAFWHVIGLVRFEPGELDPYLPRSLRIPDDEPLFTE